MSVYPSIVPHCLKAILNNRKQVVNNVSEKPALSSRKVKLIFVNIVISCVATSMLSTALTTALPSISTELDISVTTAQWLTSGYSLAMGIMLPLTAFLITRVPTRKLYLTGIAVFIIGLVASILSPGFIILMFGRILQACATGILSAMGQVLILSIFPPENRGTAMGAYGLSVTAAPVIAPTIAGILIDSFGWRMIFIVVLAVMVISFIYGIFVLENVLETKDIKMDFPSFVLSILAFGGLTLAVGNLGNAGFLSPVILVPLIIGAVTMVIFVYKQLHMENPLLELRTLKQKNFTLAVIASMLLYLVLMGSTTVIPLYVQNIQGYSATISGLVVLPGSLVSAALSLVAGKIYDKIGIRRLFIVGAACLLLSNLLMLTVTMNTSIWAVSFYNVIRNISCACLLMPLVTWGAGSFKGSNTAHATALLNSFRTIAGAVGTAVFVAVMTMVTTNSESTLGDNAAIHGFNMTFAGMAIAAAALLAIPIFFLRKNKTG